MFETIGNGEMPYGTNAIIAATSESGYNQDKSGIDTIEFVEPMLAKSYNDYADDIEFPVYSQPKYDGIRCIVQRDSMKSRAGKGFVSCPHISEALSGFFKKYPNISLDGELYCDKFANDFNRICSLVKRGKPSDADLKECAEAIQYWVYDYVDTSKPFSERIGWLSTALPNHPSIRIVPTELVKTHEDLNRLYSQYVEVGYEGQMVRLDAPYENKRSATLLKRKEFKDDEFLILDIIEGDGNKSGMAASMLLQNSAGQLFNSNIKGNREYLRGLLRDRQTNLGKMCTVKYFNLTPDGIPRFPYVIAIRDYE
jgi:DNA ligase-1